MFRRVDVLWVAALAVLSFVLARYFWGLSLGATIACVLVLSAGRLSYAWYAGRTWR